MSTLKADRRKITVEIAIGDLVPVIENHGGYLGRRCLLCGEMGWDGGTDVGYRHGTPDRVNGKILNGMRHKASCPLNEYIDGNTGRILPEEKKR